MMFLPEFWMVSLLPLAETAVHSFNSFSNGGTTTQGNKMSYSYKSHMSANKHCVHKPSRLRSLPSLNDPVRSWCRMWLISKPLFSWGGPVGGTYPQCSATTTGFPCTTLKRGAPEEPPKVVALWVTIGPVE